MFALYCIERVIQFLFRQRIQLVIQSWEIWRVDKNLAGEKLAYFLAPSYDRKSSLSIFVNATHVLNNWTYRWSRLDEQRVMISRLGGVYWRGNRPEIIKEVLRADHTPDNSLAELLLPSSTSTRYIRNWVFSFFKTPRYRYCVHVIIKKTWISFQGNFKIRSTKT